MGGGVIAFAEVAAVTVHTGGDGSVGREERVGGDREGVEGGRGWGGGRHTAARNSKTHQKMFGELNFNSTRQKA